MKTADELIVQIGHAIEANGGRCQVIEDALIEAQSFIIRNSKPDHEHETFNDDQELDRLDASRCPRCEGTGTYRKFPDLAPDAFWSCSLCNGTGLMSEAIKGVL